MITAARRLSKIEDFRTAAPYWQAPGYIREYTKIQRLKVRSLRLCAQIAAIV